MCNDIPGCVEEWHIPGKTARKWVHCSLGDVSWIQKAALQYVQNHIACDSVYQAFPCAVSSTASDKCWGEIASFPASPTHATMMENKDGGEPGTLSHVMRGTQYHQGNNYPSVTSHVEPTVPAWAASVELGDFRDSNRSSKRLHRNGGDSGEDYLVRGLIKLTFSVN